MKERGMNEIDRAGNDMNKAADVERQKKKEKNERYSKRRTKLMKNRKQK